MLVYQRVPIPTFCFNFRWNMLFLMLFLPQLEISMISTGLSTCRGITKFHPTCFPQSLSLLVVYNPSSIYPHGYVLWSRHGKTNGLWSSIPQWESTHVSNTLLLVPALLGVCCACTGVQHVACQVSRGWSCDEAAAVVPEGSEDIPVSSAIGVSSSSPICADTVIGTLSLLANSQISAITNATSCGPVKDVSSRASIRAKIQLQSVLKILLSTHPPYPFLGW